MSCSSLPIPTPFPTSNKSHCFCGCTTNKYIPFSGGLFLILTVLFQLESVIIRLVPKQIQQVLTSLTVHVCLIQCIYLYCQKEGRWSVLKLTLKLHVAVFGSRNSTLVDTVFFIIMDAQTGAQSVGDFVSL